MNSYKHFLLTTIIVASVALQHMTMHAKRLPATEEEFAHITGNFHMLASDMEGTKEYEESLTKTIVNQLCNLSQAEAQHLLQSWVDEKDLKRGQAALWQIVEQLPYVDAHSDPSGVDQTNCTSIWDRQELADWLRDQIAIHD